MDAQHAYEHHQTDQTYEPRREWHKHFSAFLGIAPEKHWLFRGRRFKPWFSASTGPPGLFNPFVAGVLSRGGGLLSLYILHLLAQKPRHGNDLMKVIEQRTEGRWGSNPGAVYPLLSQLEEGGLLIGEWQDPEKRTRRIYKLTSLGSKELDRLKQVIRPKLEEAIGVLQDLFQDLDGGEEA
ncbi:MAG: PadR family transcriptional regulator [Chloroflexi bacterium]|nr:PadR family transcriptional regulator [Chloroflexota bacterium]